jgi:hypothetical protein
MGKWKQELFKAKWGLTPLVNKWFIAFFYKK